MKLTPILATLVVIAAGTADAQAQVQLDIAKVTCNQFALYKITDPRNIAIWLSGYYQGKRDDTVIDTQALIKNADKLRDYCIQHPNALVFQASPQFLAPAR
jgi:hypothetical protein